MYQKEISTHKSNLADLMILALSIQELGLATVCVDFSGHVMLWSVRIYAPKWVEGAFPVFNTSSSLIGHPERLPEAIEVLRNILVDGVESIPGYQESIDKGRAAKIAQFEALKAELGEEAAL